MKFLGVTILQGVEFPIFPLIFARALQQCRSTACDQWWQWWEWLYCFVQHKDIHSTHFAWELTANSSCLWRLTPNLSATFSDVILYTHTHIQVLIRLWGSGTPHITSTGKLNLTTSLHHVLARICPRNYRSTRRHTDTHEAVLRQLHRSSVQQHIESKLSVLVSTSSGASDELCSSILHQLKLPTQYTTVTNTEFYCYYQSQSLRVHMWDTMQSVIQRHL